MIDKLHPAPAFSDGRGDITNLIAQPLQHVALITSRPGAVRGNHLHKTDSHFTHLVSGKAWYYQEVDGEVESCEMKVGDLVFTPAGVPHAIAFEMDSVFLAFCTAQRLGGRYQEDTEPWELVSQR